MACIGTGGILNTIGKILVKIFKYMFTDKFGIIFSTLISLILYIYFVYSSDKEEDKTKKISKKLTLYWFIPFIIIITQIFYFVKRYSNIFNLKIDNLRTNKYGLLIIFFIVFALLNIVTSIFAKKYFDAKILTIIISCFTIINILFMFKSNNYLQYIFLIISGVIASILGTLLYKKDKDKNFNRTLALQFVLYLGGTFYLFLKMIDKIFYLFFYLLADIIGIFSVTDKTKLIGSLKKGFLHKLLIILIIVGVVMIGANMSQFTYMLLDNKKENLKYFEENRCNIENILLYPFVRPKEFSDISFQSNFNYCSSRVTKSIIETFLSPFYDIIDTIISIFSTIFTNIEDIRGMFNKTRTYFSEMSYELYTKLRNQYSRFAYLANAFNKLFTKIYQTFDNLFHVILYIFYTLGSIWNGPIGGFARFFCFDGDTEIELKNNNFIKIKDIKLNDELLTGKVLSIMEFSSDNVDMYNYKNIIVAGSHLVNENKWIRVENSKFSKKIKFNKSKIYCLRTTDNRIIINGQEFSDYDETNNIQINKQIQQLISNKLNNKFINVNYKQSHWGFCPLTKMNNNINIIGKIKFIADKNDIYEYNNIIATGNQFVYHNDNWIQMRTIGIKKIYDYNPIFYNIVTENNIIKINNILFRDFEQCSDEKTNQQIDNIVINYLNN